MGELEDTRKVTLWHFMDHNFLTIKQSMKIMFLDYQSLTVVILADTFGLLLLGMVKELLPTIGIALAQLIEVIVLLLL